MSLPVMHVYVALVLLTGGISSFPLHLNVQVSLHGLTERNHVLPRGEDKVHERILDDTYGLEHHV